MSERINYQTIKQDGKPLFVVVPYEDFLKLCPEINQNDGIPHEVVQNMIKKDISRIRAWREYLNLTQKEVADKMGISQAGYCQIEAGNARPRKKTLEKLSAIFKIPLENLQ